MPCGMANRGSGLLHPRDAPAPRIDQLFIQSATAAPGIGRLPLVKAAVGASLACGVGGESLAVDPAGLVFVTQRNREWLVLLEARRLGRRVAGQRQRQRGGGKRMKEAASGCHDCPLAWRDSGGSGGRRWPHRIASRKRRDDSLVIELALLMRRGSLFGSTNFHARHVVQFHLLTGNLNWYSRTSSRCNSSSSGSCSCLIR